MITRTEIDDWADRFGVPTEQIERDHLVSHMLAALAVEGDPETKFYGGTALCRSYLQGSRLSEDIDLLHPSPSERLSDLRDVFSRALRREFPDLEWAPDGHHTKGTAALASARAMTPIKVEVHELGVDTRAWDFTLTPVELRYSDVPPNVQLSCPSLATFAAMKALAWSDRRAPRDLFDLDGLARINAITSEADDRLRSARGFGFVEADFQRVPPRVAAAWKTELGAQVGALPDPQQCLERVAAAVRALHSDTQ